MTIPSAEPDPSGVPTPARSSGRTVARNTMVLMLAQVLGTPLSMVINAVMAQRLGPQVFGQFYLVSTFAGFGFLFVDWGLGAVVPAQVARNRRRAGQFLGSAMVWRLIATPIVAGILILGCFAWGFSRDFQIALALVCLGQAIAIIVRTCGDVIRGFERADVAAYSYVGGQFLTAALVIPTLLLGGKLHAALVATAVASLVMIVPVWRALRPAGVEGLGSDVPTIKELLREGTSFFAFGLILTLQPLIDALYLSRLVPEEVVGWHAAAKKLIGVIINPVVALNGALYPTLCRLWVQSPEEYRSTARGALRACMVMTVPLAVGCAVYAELGILLFNKQSFGPAEDNLRIMAIYVLLVYVTMVMGTCLSAAGRQRPWTVVQFLCIVVSAIADPILVHLFQQRTGNGGLGICVAMVLSEIFMLAGGVWLMPRGIFDRSVLRSALLAIGAGAAMAGGARLLSPINAFVAAPLSVALYLGVLYAIGGIDKEHVQMLRSFAARKFARR